LGLSIGLLPARADRQVQASTRPPRRFRITVPLSHPGLLTVVREHRRLTSLYGTKRSAIPPVGGPRGWYHHLFEAVIRNLHRNGLAIAGLALAAVPGKAAVRRSYQVVRGNVAEPSGSMRPDGSARWQQRNCERQSYWKLAYWGACGRGAGATGAAGGTEGTGARVPWPAVVSGWSELTSVPPR
jgi:hypothetical protein